MQILAGVRLVALRCLGEEPVDACEACSAENHCVECGAMLPKACPSCRTHTWAL